MQLQAKRYFGNLQCMAIVSCKESDVEAIYRNLEQRFQPEKKVFFSLDSRTSGTTWYDDFPLRDNDANIYQIVLMGKGQTFILEFCLDSVIVKHLLPGELDFHTGVDIMRDYVLPELLPDTIVLGYELSIHVESIDASIQDTVADVSVHPVVVLKRTAQGMQRHNHFHHANAEQLHGLERYIQRISSYTIMSE